MEMVNGGSRLYTFVDAAEVRVQHSYIGLSGHNTEAPDSEMTHAMTPRESVTHIMASQQAEQATLI
ncbi:hypothetical protein DPV78_012211 [Talaromyces pinophilus]|jgi:hypothetical protein|nr:hypothetical protein DPV78_012211 [Talaromyces pinophilus]